MSTVFDYLPTETELNAIGFNSVVTWASLGIIENITKEQYISLVKEDKALFDIALLLEFRNQNASEIWAKIPDLHAQYLRGFDYEIKEE